MTGYRICVLDSDGARHVVEADTFPAVLQVLMERVPWHDQPKVITIHQLAPFEPTTWSQVAEGDEVIAPNNTVWSVEDTRVENGVSVYTILNVLTGDEVDSRPQPTAEVRRRSGPATAVRAMLADAGINTTFVRG